MAKAVQAAHARAAALVNAMLPLLESSRAWHAVTPTFLVGANSPNLWPTMCSETSKRTMRLLPLCTKNTHRKKSGKMTLARLWVLITAGAGAPWKRVLFHHSGCWRATAMTSFNSDTAT